MIILHVIPGDLWAGAEAQVYYSLKAIGDSSQNRFTVILFNNGELYRRFRNINIDVILIDENVNNSITICRKIKRILKERSVEILHVHEYKSQILSGIAKVLGRRKCALIRTMHGLTSVPFRWKNIKSYLILTIDKFFLKHYTDYIIAVSEDLESSLYQDRINANTILIQNGIDTKMPLQKAPEDVRKEFNIASNEFWIGTAARLESVKNIEMLVEAARILSTEYLDIKFRISIFGDGELKESLKSQIIQYDLASRAVLHGHYNDMLPVINALDVFVLTSRHEGLPMSLLEAMSVGTIPVCTRVGGMKEVITHGDDGFLVEPDNSKDLAETLFYIYNNKSRITHINKNAIKTIKRCYSIEKSTQQLLSLYGSSLS